MKRLGGNVEKSQCLREKRGKARSLSHTLDSVAFIFSTLLYITVPPHTRPYMIV